MRDAADNNTWIYASVVCAFKPNREVVFSMGWNFPIVNKVRINNFGFGNDQDYDPEAATPFMAVTGDSYGEASHVPYPATLYGRLAAAVGPRGRVYSFASSGSGSALSEYLAYRTASGAPHGRIEAGKALR